MEVNVFIKKGARDVPIYNMTIYDNLSSLLKTNSHGL